MSIIESAFQGLKKYADFKSRASREEFWSFLGLVVILQAVAGFVGFAVGVGPLLSGIVSALLSSRSSPWRSAASTTSARSGRELLVPCIMLLALPLAFAFRGVLPQIVALGFLGMTLLVFANLLRLFLKKGSTVPNSYGGAPTAFSFAG